MDNKRKSPARPRGLLIFDLDGTLFRGDRGTARAVWETCDRHGLPRPSADAINGYFGRPVHEFHDWFRGMAPGRDMTLFLEEMDRREFDLVAETGELYPGVREMLERFRREFRLAICSNGSKIYIDTVLESRGITGLFDRVRHRERPEESKPEMAREVLGEIPARPAVLVGDRRDDFRAARDNGIFFIGSAYGFGAPGEIDGADAVVREAREIPAAVERLLAGFAPDANTARP
ncbi:MAG: HAD family hydrolase [Candidatus Eisenbacteria bacterium]|nr:HAD family hydrolase [Candidatus Eisenbacteria bacterium]